MSKVMNSMYLGSELESQHEAALMLQSDNSYAEWSAEDFDTTAEFVEWMKSVNDSFDKEFGGSNE